MYWADSFAQCGYPTFRIDLPGLGDSEGDVPEPMLQFVNGGGYGPLTAACVSEINHRFDLSGMITMGLCAGAVTALYGAAATKECKGTMLLDPYFYETHDERPKIRSEISRWTMWSRIGAFASKIYDHVRHLWRLACGNRLPGNANRRLLQCWAQLVSSGTPVLALKSPAFKARGLKPRVGEFDYFAYLQAISGQSDRVAIEFVEGTNHSFADGVGRAAVRARTLQWLNDYFPSVAREEVAAGERNALTA